MFDIPEEETYKFCMRTRMEDSWGAQRLLEPGAKEKEIQAFLAQVGVSFQGNPKKGGLPCGFPSKPAKRGFPF